MNKILVVIGLLAAIGLGAVWYVDTDDQAKTSLALVEQLKEDITLLQGTIVTIKKNEREYYSFSSHDGNSSVAGIAKLDASGHFKLLWTGQEAPNCSTFPKEIPTSLMGSCYDGDTLKSR